MASIWMMVPIGQLVRVYHFILGRNYAAAPHIRVTVRRLLNRSLTQNRLRSAHPRGRSFFKRILPEIVLDLIHRMQKTPKHKKGTRRFQPAPQ